MTAQKFIGEFQEPCCFHSESEQAKEWRRTARMLSVKILVCGGRVWIKKDKHYVGIVQKRVYGGEWEEVRLIRRETTDDIIKKFSAKPANFRGQPKTN